MAEKITERRTGQRTGQRSEREAALWQYYFTRDKEIFRQIREAGYDILQSYNFNDTGRFIQHGNITVKSHCLNVAKYSILISEKFHIPCRRRELIRGALLHDYFLYDWHHKDYLNPHRLHGFFHPGVALKNAAREYHLTPRERDIIKKHMWPLTVLPPMCREAWIVTAADKCCSFMETVGVLKGHDAVKPISLAQQKESSPEVGIII